MWAARTKLQKWSAMIAMTAPYSRITVVRVERRGAEDFTFHVRCHPEPSSGVEQTPVDEKIPVRDKLAGFFCDNAPLAGYEFGAGELEPWMKAHAGRFDLGAFIRANVYALGMKQSLQAHHRRGVPRE
jgi:hypothetical protein